MPTYMSLFNILATYYHDCKLLTKLMNRRSQWSTSMGFTFTWRHRRTCQIIIPSMLQISTYSESITPEQWLHLDLMGSGLQISPYHSWISVHQIPGGTSKGYSEGPSGDESWSPTTNSWSFLAKLSLSDQSRQIARCWFSL